MEIRHCFRVYGCKYLEDYDETFVMSSFHTWEDVKRYIKVFRDGIDSADKKAKRQWPNMLKRAWMFRLPVEQDTEIMECIVSGVYWIDSWNERQAVVKAEDGEEYYDTDTCIIKMKKKEAKALLSEMKDDI